MVRFSDLLTFEITNQNKDAESLPYQSVEIFNHKSSGLNSPSPSAMFAFFNGRKILKAPVFIIHAMHDLFIRFEKFEPNKTRHFLLTRRISNPPMKKIELTTWNCDGIEMSIKTCDWIHLFFF